MATGERDEDEQSQQIERGGEEDEEFVNGKFNNEKENNYTTYQNTPSNFIIKLDEFKIETPITFHSNPTLS